MNKSAEDIKNFVLKKIHLGEIHKQPRVYFVAQITLVIVVVVLTLVVSVFAVSFALFSIHESGELFLLGFGIRGFLTFLSLFPWLTLVIAALLVFLLEWLLRHFKFSYRRPILYVFFTAICLIFVGGLLIFMTPLHTILLDKADKNELPIFGEMYENIRMPHEDRGEFRGVVVSIATSTLTITHNDRDRDVDDGTRIITVPQGFDASQFHIGDRVYVAGNIASDTITAYGLEKF